MLPNPLHPAVVHFPVVLAFLLPVLVGGALWAIHRGAKPQYAWAFPIVGVVGLVVSAWVAVQTGGADSERVERIVSEMAIEGHEEMAEAFLAVSAGVVVVALLGLVKGIAGRVARILTGVGALVLLALVARVGHSGGQLVYRYGAASAYAQPSGGPGEVPTVPPDGGRRERRGTEGR